jgi:hypothetical protein
MEIEVLDIEEHEDGGSTITFKFDETVREALLRYALLHIIEASCKEMLDD